MDRARADAESVLSLPPQLHGIPRALNCAQFRAGPNAPARLPMPAVPMAQFSERICTTGPGGANLPPPLVMFPPYASGLDPQFCVQRGPGSIAPAPAPPPAAQSERQLLCTFTYLHSKAVGIRAKVNVQERPFSRVTWVEMKSPSPPICERCTSTLQKHFKNSTTSKQLCREFLKYVFKYRCRLCLEWCSTDASRNVHDFLCPLHATKVGDNHNSNRQIATRYPARSSANCGSAMLESGRHRDGASADPSAVHPALSTKDTHGRTLPYDMTALRWNSDFTMNVEQKYCYCGQNKQEPSLQCSLCKNWFHRDCTSDVVPAKGSGKFLPFQLNYDFTCAVCSSSNRERFELITCSWIDSILGAVGNLMWETQREFFKVVEVADHLEAHWEILCYRRERNRNWRGPLNSYFTNNKERLRQKKPYWGITDPTEDGLGPILQPCRVLRGPARPPPENTAKSLRCPARPPNSVTPANSSKVQTISSVTREDQLHSERATTTREKQQQTETADEPKLGRPPLFNTLNAVAAQLLLEADQLATRRFAAAAGGNKSLPQNSLQFNQELLPVLPGTSAESLLYPATKQQMSSATAGTFQHGAAEPRLLGVPAVKQQLPTAPVLEAAVKRKLPANAQELHMVSAEPPTKRSCQQAQALQNATLQAAAAAAAAKREYEQLAFL